MNSISKILMPILVWVSITACNAEIKNSKTITVKIFGNCEMCKTTIEKARNVKKSVKVNWNQETKMAAIT